VPAKSIDALDEQSEPTDEDQPKRALTPDSRGEAYDVAKSKGN
jgi:hypothetical protein